MSRIWNNRFISQEVSHPICNSILFHFSLCSRLPSFLCVSSSVIPFVLLRRLMIIVLYRTYSWQPSKFNNGFNSYTRINHLWHILPYSVITAEHASVAILWYSEGKVQYPGQSFHYLPLDPCRETSSRTTNQAIQIFLFGEYVISLACSFITKKFFLLRNLITPSIMELSCLIRFRMVSYSWSGCFNLMNLNNLIWQ